MIDKNVDSFVQSLFAGKIKQDIISTYPQFPKAEKETLELVLGSVRDLLEPKEKEFREWDQKGEMPEGFIEELKQFGLFSLIVPEQFGGMGFGATSYSRVMQEIAHYDASIGVTLGAHSSIGMKGLLLFGTEQQKAKYLPKLATGELIAAFCLTEPGAGSDAASIRTKAEKQGDLWVLNGEKLWITNGSIAGFFTVFAKTEFGMTAFIVTKETPGITVGPHENKMGIRGSFTTTVNFDNVKVSEQSILGEVGKGFKVAMAILNNGRTGLGGGSVGAMKKLITLATKQAKERKQFGQTIADFELTKQKIAQMAIDTYAAESVVNMVNGLIDQGYKDYAVEAAISKVFATEALWRTADEALQIAGGNGFMKEFPYEQIMRDSRINRIFEGTNDILRMMIGLTGMKNVGTQLKSIKGIGAVSKYLLQQVALKLNIGQDKLCVGNSLKPSAKILEDGVRNLALSVNCLLRKYGKDIMTRQIQTKRIADITMDLYVLSCVLSRTNTEMGSNAVEMTNIFASQVKDRIENNLLHLNDDNKDLKELSDFVLDHESYVWDNI